MEVFPIFAFLHLLAHTYCYHKGYLLSLRQENPSTLQLLCTFLQKVSKEYQAILQIFGKKGCDLAEGTLSNQMNALLH